MTPGTPYRGARARGSGEAAIVEVGFVQAQEVAEFVEISEADFVFERDVFVLAEFVDRADEDEDRAESFGKVVFFEAVELPEHVGIGFVVRPFLQESGDFLGVFADGARERGDGGFDGFVGAVEEVFPGNVRKVRGLRRGRHFF